jgi:hypothetical protein
LYRGIATAVLWVRVKIMSRVASGILAAAAATFAFGAVHLAGASGNTGLVSDRLAQTGLSSVALSNTIVNRQAKSDRAISAQNLERGATIAFEVPSLPNTTLIVRVPADNAAGNAPARAPARPSSARRMAACEPSVSVLTAVAKQLGPSRCLA